MYAGIAAVALMAVPVQETPDGPQTALAGSQIEAPVLGVVQAFEPAWVADVMQWAVVAVAVPVLIWAANTAMLGVSRHVYVLATNRQIPSWAGRLERTHATPYVAIGIAAVMALALAIPGDIEFLAGVYAFGALLAATIAHLVDRPAAVHRPRPRAAVPRAGQRDGRGPAGSAAGGRRGDRQRARCGSA